MDRELEQDTVFNHQWLYHTFKGLATPEIIDDILNHQNEFRKKHPTEFYLVKWIEDLRTFKQHIDERDKATYNICYNSPEFQNIETLIEQDAYDGALLQLNHFLQDETATSNAWSKILAAELKCRILNQKGDFQEMIETLQHFDDVFPLMKTKHWYSDMRMVTATHLKWINVLDAYLPKTPSVDYGTRQMTLPFATHPEEERVLEQLLNYHNELNATTSKSLIEKVETFALAKKYGLAEMFDQIVSETSDIILALKDCDPNKREEYQFMLTLADMYLQMGRTEKVHEVLKELDSNIADVTWVRIEEFEEVFCEKRRIEGLLLAKNDPSKTEKALGIMQDGLEVYEKEDRDMVYAKNVHSQAELYLEIGERRSVLNAIIELGRIVPYFEHKRKSTSDAITLRLQQIDLLKRLDPTDTEKEYLSNQVMLSFVQAGLPTGYEVKARIGESGSKEVYLVSLPGGLERVVKIYKQEHLKQQVADLREIEDLYTTFLVEFGALSTLNHPNIVRVYGHGKLFGTFYFEEEYIKGKDLEKAIPDISLAPNMMQIINQVYTKIIGAVKYLYEKNLNLGDIKLDNVLVNEDFSEVRLTDFEFIAEGNALGERPLGSWRYAAPEQRNNGQRNWTTDVFALGASLFYLLEGMPTSESGEMQQPDFFSKITDLPKSEYESKLNAALDKFPTQHYTPFLRKALAYNAHDRFQDINGLSRYWKELIPNEKSS